jgi:uroporphyrinogen III methyltransferase/synthase
VGKTTTKELEKRHISPDVESVTGSAEGLINYFKGMEPAKNKILLPRSDKGLKYFPDELRLSGNYVTDIPVYTNTVNENAVKTDLSEIRKIVFTSPSGVEAFTHLYGEIPGEVLLVAKGKTTENSIRLHLNGTA